MKIINIKNKNEALEILERFKQREQSGVEIKLINVHLCDINDLVGEKIFSKNDLYVTGETLYDVMQPLGGKGHHHFHGITIYEFLDALNFANKPIGIYTTYRSRYVIATLAVNSTNENIVLVIEKGAGLKNNRDANINKLISIYPKHNLDNAIIKHKGIKL
ncbi:MAG: hypothetical protein MJ214_03540 [Bacilli bacterium]|nr:hypothetical protein [Bacilli bacterium]